LAQYAVQYYAGWNEVKKPLLPNREAKFVIRPVMLPFQGGSISIE